MVTQRKIRKCPKGGGKTGFEAMINLHGYHLKRVSFSGKLISEEREQQDSLEKTVSCLDCGKSIDLEKINTTNL